MCNIYLAINIYIGPHLHPITSNVGWIFWTIRYIRSVSDIFGGKNTSFLLGEIMRKNLGKLEGSFPTGWGIPRKNGGVFF